ncbi:hypothetical protein ACJIZ3_021274 [Penstemon smallii]|uniref:Saposin B-type domain-containing protein n=1 Tax=Penstemon smallii TaxID=265156 RepID=A0ABD3SKZ9_9LAMI
MAKSNQKLILSLLYVIVIFSWMPIESHCAKKPVGIARREDIPFIKCQVCQKLASQLHKQAEITPKKISEFEIIEIAENVCNLKKQEANWILKNDIVEEGDKLKLVEKDSGGQCNSECKTIERACQEVLGYSDTDVAEYLYKKKPQLNPFVDFVCKDLTEACSSKPPPVPKARSPGEPFVPKSAKETEMEKLMKSIEGMPGAPGMKTYSQEDFMNQKFGDEDDDETNLPFKLLMPIYIHIFAGKNFERERW